MRERFRRQNHSWLRCWLTHLCCAYSAEKTVSRITFVELGCRTGLRRVLSSASDNYCYSMMSVWFPCLLTDAARIHGFILVCV